MLEIVGDGMCERCEAPQGTRQSLRRDGAALVRLCCKAPYSLEERARLFARKSVHARIDVALIDRDHVHRVLVIWCAGLAEKPLGVGHDRRPILFINRHAVQHRHERQTALTHTA